MAHNKNYIKKAMLIKDIVDKHYEPGRQDRNKMWIFRNVVNKIYPMHFQTYYKMLKIAERLSENKVEKQMTLFD